jgi:hypothetical protein
LAAAEGEAATDGDDKGAAVVGLAGAAVGAGAVVGAAGAADWQAAIAGTSSIAAANKEDALATLKCMRLMTPCESVWL